MALDLNYDPNWKPQGAQDAGPDLTYDPSWTPPAKPEGGLIASLASTAGQLVKGAGQAAADYLPGVTQDNALKSYGQEVIDANPTAVRSLSDVADSPWTATKEAVGNALGSMGAMVGAQALGRGVEAVAPFTGPARPIVSLLGKGIQFAGPVATAALPSYGGIREQQIQDDPTRADSPEAKARALAGAGAVGLIERSFGPEKLALSAMTKEGRAKVIESMAGKSLVGSIGKGMAKGAAVEGAEELVQNPVEQFAGYQDPTTPENLQETAFGGVMGALGGGVLGGAGGGISYAARPEQPQVDPNAGPLSRAAATAQQTGAAGLAQAAQQAQAAGVADDATTVAETATDPSAGLSARLTPEAMRAIRQAEGYGPESVNEVLRAYQIARNPELDPTIRQQATEALNGFWQGFDAQRAAEQQRILSPKPDVPPAGSFSDMNEFADFIAQERADLEQRRNPPPFEEMKGVDAGFDPMSRARNQVPPASGSFGAMNEFADLLGQEQADVQQRRDAIAQTQGLQRDSRLESIGNEIDANRQQQTAQARRSLLDQLDADPETVNLLPRFESMLKKQGYAQRRATPEERDLIARRMDARAALVNADQEPVAPNELDAAAMGIRERQPKVRQPQQAPAEKPQRAAFPMTQTGAQRQAAERTQATGQAFEVVPHPTVKGRFAVQAVADQFRDATQMVAPVAAANTSPERVAETPEIEQVAPTNELLNSGEIGTQGTENGIEATEAVPQQAQRGAAQQAEVDPLSLTPKQYHEDKLRRGAVEYGLSLAEVREMEDTPGGRANNEQEWVNTVKAAFRDGKEIPRAALDKLEEVRPGAFNSFLHDHPNAKVPQGYQSPQARQIERQNADALRADRVAARQQRKGESANAPEPAQTLPEDRQASRPQGAQEGAQESGQGVGRTLEVRPSKLAAVAAHRALRKAYPEAQLEVTKQGDGWAVVDRTDDPFTDSPANAVEGAMGRLAQLQGMADAAGWSERGGKLLRDEGAEGEVTGRTKWLPTEAWFAGKPAGVTEQHMRSAVEKVASGRGILTKPERDGLAYMQETLRDLESQDRARQNEEASRTAELDALASEAAAELTEAEVEAIREQIAVQMESATQDDYLLALKEAFHEKAIQSRTGREAGQADARGARQGVPEGRGEGGREASAFSLESQTPQDLAARDATQRETAEREQRDQQERERKAQADAERGSFTLTGSDRAADVQAAMGQGGLFDGQSATPNSPEPRAEQGQQADAGADTGRTQFSRAEPSAKAKAKARDAAYLDAVERGDMDEARKLVDQAARDAGYISGAEYRMQHQAPNSDGDVSIADVRDVDLVPNDYWTKPQWYQGTPEEMSAWHAVMGAFRRLDARKNEGKGVGLVGMTVYRAVPKNVKDDAPRNGDWVSPSLEYAKAEGAMIPEGYRIISHHALLKHLYWDGNSIAELGYDDGKGYAYKNTKNNRKLFDVVTRDDDGAVIPLSKRFNQRSDDPRYSFAGESARTADTHALATAQSRIAAGENAETVRQETGWHKAPDGKWRFEIDDSDAAILPALQSLGRGGYDAREIASVTYRKRDDGTYDLTLNPPSPKETSDFVTLTAVRPEVMRAVLPDAAVRAVERNAGTEDFIGNFEEAKRIDAAFTFDGFNALPLDQVIDHPALFAAYPALREVMVQVDPKLGVGGAFSLVEHTDGTTTQVIRIGKGQQLSTLMHETQHGIQDIEGFASGGTARQMMPENSKEILARRQEILDRITAAPDDADVSALWDQLDAMEENPVITAEDRYRRLAGETESRNTQARQKLTAAERRATSPEATADVKASDVIVVFNGTEMASAPAPANAAPMQSTGTTPDAIWSAVESLVGPLRRRRIIVVQSADVLVEQGILQSRDANGAQAFVKDGKAYFIAGNIQPGNERAVFLHEVGAHLGLERILSPLQRSVLLNRIKTWAAQANGSIESRIAQAAQRRVEAAGVTGTDADAELIAYAVEEAVKAGINPTTDTTGPIGQWFKTLWSALRTALEKLGLVNASKLTAQDVVNLAHGAANVAMSEDATGGDVQLSRADQIDSPAFKKWFGDSRVVDEDGRPLVVYHGTDQDFAKFKTNTGAGGELGAGAYFTSDKGAASQYAFFAGEDRRGNAAVYPVYLSIQNPFDATNNDAIPSRKKLIAQGYDGIVSDDGTYTQIVAFRPEQIKSATGNSGAFSPSDPRIQFSRAASTIAPVWDVPESSKLFNRFDTDSLLYTLQDKHVDTKRVVEAIRKQSGDIADEFNPYLQEELFHGRSAKGVKDFLDSELRPLLTEMSLRKVDMATLEKFLHARHAEERNIQIAKINPKMPDGGSGMETQEARDYLAALDPAQKALLDKLAARIDAINASTRQLLVDAGLEKPETIKAWEGAYKHYVPLQREEVDSGGLGIGQGFSVKGSASKRAMGSDKAVADIIANIAMQRERAIVRAEKNRVSQALYALALKAPNPEFWMPINPAEAQAFTPKQQQTVIDELTSMGLDPADAMNFVKEPKQRYIDPRTGLVSERINPVMRSAPNVLATRINGEDRYVFFNAGDERANRMVHALKNLDADQLGRMLQTSAKLTRWFASVNTQYNPVFGAINLTRDVQGAILNLSTTPIRGQEAKVLANTFSALKGIYTDLRAIRKGGAASSQWAGLWEEFQKEGGQTGYRDMFSNAAERAEAIQKELDQIGEGKLKAGGRAIFDWLSDYNESMENAVRLATYKAAKDQGISAQQAASIAKSITVNFNRKGAITTQAGALYAFFNAAVQGTTRMAQTLNGPAGRKIILGGLTLGAMQAVLLAAAGFDDEDPPEFVRERSIIIPTGGGKYISIPMPLGFHVIPSTSRILTEWALSGFKHTPKRFSDVLSLFADTFNPIGNAGWSMQTLAPTALDPLAALAENRDWSGKPIAREDFNKMAPTPGYSRAKDTASWVSKTIAYWANLATGGTDYKPGMFSPTPDQLDYLIGQFTGGVGREYLKAEQTATSVWTGEDLPPHKIPLLGRFYGDTTGQSSEANRFYSNIKEVNQHKLEIDGRRKDGGDVGEYMRDNPTARLAMVTSRFDTTVRKLRQARRDAVERGDSQERIKALDVQMTNVMRQFNEQFARLDE